MSKLVQEVGARLVEMRAGRTYAQFAEDTGVHASLLHRYENGALPRVDNLLLIARKEKISLNWLVLGQGPKQLK